MRGRHYNNSFSFEAYYSSSLLSDILDNRLAWIRQRTKVGKNEWGVQPVSCHKFETKSKAELRVQRLSCHKSRIARDNIGFRTFDAIKFPRGIGRKGFSQFDAIEEVN